MSNFVFSEEGLRRVAEILNQKISSGALAPESYLYIDDDGNVDEKDVKKLITMALQQEIGIPLDIKMDDYIS